MPDIGQHEKLKLKKPRGNADGGQGTTEPKPARGNSAVSGTSTRTPGVADKKRSPTKPPAGLFDDPDVAGAGSGDTEDDEIIEESLNHQKSGEISTTKKLIFGGATVLAVIVVFLLLRGTIFKKQEPPADISTQTLTETEDPNAGPIIGSSGVGTQDFTTDTTMRSDSPLTDPNDFLKDIYGLTLRVDYTVAEIQNAADFVSYTKHRGTWGGGLELYWLDCTYKDAQYSVQVPFKYYKELDDTGIVPVKMEVLRIKSETSNDYLTVISYMCLDEQTLKSILKTQTK